MKYAFYKVLRRNSIFDIYILNDLNLHENPQFNKNYKQIINVQFAFILDLVAGNFSYDGTNGKLIVNLRIRTKRGGER